MRLIHHLSPPTALWHLTIDRFSPYLSRSGDLGLRNVTPFPAYVEVLPNVAPAAKLAYHFIADYESEAHCDLNLMREFGVEFGAWRRAWMRPYAGGPEVRIDRVDASYVLTGHPGDGRQ